MIIFYLLQRFHTILCITLCHLHTVVFYVLLVWYYEMLCQKWRNKTVKSIKSIKSYIQQSIITRSFPIPVTLAMDWLHIVQFCYHYSDMYGAHDISNLRFDCLFNRFFMLTPKDTFSVLLAFIGGNPPCHCWIPLAKASDEELWCFLWGAPKKTQNNKKKTQNDWESSLNVADLRRHSAHCDVTVMFLS